MLPKSNTDSVSHDLPKFHDSLFQQQNVPAGFWIRVAANILDGIVVAIIYITVAVLFEALVEAYQVDLRARPEYFIKLLYLQLVTHLVIIPVMYFGWFYRHKGATPGKLLLGLRVLDYHSSTNISYLRTWVREMPGKAFSSIIFGLGFLMVAWHPEKRALHDIIASSKVIKKI